MAKKLPAPADAEVNPSRSAKILREGLLIGVVVACAYVALSLFTYSVNDPGWSKTGTGGPIENSAGPAGAWLADVFFSLFGNLAYLFPLMLAYQVWQLLRDRYGVRPDLLMLAVRTIGFALVMIAATGIAVMKHGIGHDSLPFSSGGLLGLTTATAIDSSFGYIGGSMLLTAMLLFGLTIFIDISWFGVMDAIGGMVMRVFNRNVKRYRDWRAAVAERKVVKESVAKRKEAVAVEVKKKEARKPPKIEAPKKEPKIGLRLHKEKQQSLFDDTPVEGDLPPIGLLDAAQKNNDKGYSEESLEGMSRLLELKLKDFNVIAEVVEVMPGPVVTRFELQPAAGVKASKITNLARDLARSLAVSSVRVVEVIEGKSVVGVEIPN